MERRPTSDIRRTLPAPPGGSLPPDIGRVCDQPDGSGRRRERARGSPTTPEPRRSLRSPPSLRNGWLNRTGSRFRQTLPAQTARGSLLPESTGSATVLAVARTHCAIRTASGSDPAHDSRWESTGSETALALRITRSQPTARSSARPYPPDSSAFVHPRTVRDLGRLYPPSAGPFSRHRPCAAGSRCESDASVGFALPAARRPGHVPGGVPAVGADRRNQRSHINFFALKRPPFRAGPTRPPSARPGTRRRSRQSHSREHRRSDNLRALTRAILPDPTRASRGSLPIESPVSALLAVSEGTLKSKPTPPLVGCRLHALGSHLPVGTAASPRRSWPIPAGPYPPSAGPFRLESTTSAVDPTVPFQLMATSASSISPDPTRSNPVGSRGSLPAISARSPAKAHSRFQLLGGFEIIGGGEPTRVVPAIGGRLDVLVRLVDGRRAFRALFFIPPSR